MKKCFLMGHRDADSSLKTKLSAEIERHISELSVTEFLVGTHGAFDRLAAAALGEATLPGLWPTITPRYGASKNALPP